MEYELYWRLGCFFAVLLAVALWENLFSKAQVEAVKNFQVEESFAAFVDQYDFSSIADSIDDCSLRTAVGRNEYRNPELGGFAVLDGCSNRCDSAGILRFTLSTFSFTSWISSGGCIECTILIWILM